MPTEIAGLFAEQGANPELLVALPEHKVPLPGSSRGESQSDLFAMIRVGDKTFAVTIEGKVDEPFDKPLGCDVMLYQAGADPHVDDPLGGWLTADQLRQRDRIVFEEAKRLQIPVAWNLAGGYQTPLSKVLAIHDGTMDECISAYIGGGNSRDGAQSPDTERTPVPVTRDAERPVQDARGRSPGAPKE